MKLTPVMPAFDHLTVDGITVEHVRDWFASMADRPGSANRAMPVLSVKTRNGRALGLPPHNSNPCKNAKRYRMQPKARFLTAEEMAREQQLLRNPAEAIEGALQRFHQDRHGLPRVEVQPQQPGVAEDDHQGMAPAPGKRERPEVDLALPSRRRLEPDRRFSRAGRNKAGIAVRKRHDEKMRAMHDAGNDRIRLAKVRLGMTRRVRQRHEHLPQTKVPFANVILHDRLLAREAMFVTKTLEDPLRRVPLLAVNRAILFQNAVDDIRERRQLRALRRLASPISRRFRMQQYLGNRLAIDPELARSFPPAQTLTMTRQSHSSIKIYRIAERG